jgi:hypothetical protein
LNDSWKRSKANAEIKAPLAKARAEGSSGLGGVQYVPATAPITSALEATNPKMKALSTRPTSPAPWACRSPSQPVDR